MKNNEKSDLEKYLKETQTWETDKVQEIIKSRKTAWIIAICSFIVACMAVLAVAALTPLKTVQPFVIRVDNATGIVDVVESLKDGKANYDEVLNKYFAQLYVRYREGYSKDLAAEYYNNVGLMSVLPEQQKYAEFFNPKNPLSPLNVYGQYKKVKVDIYGITFINPKIALVRYAKKVEETGSTKTEVTHYTATIKFKYISKGNMTDKQRFINPLGFQVEEYRNDPDSGTSIKDFNISNPAPVESGGTTPSAAPANEKGKDNE